VAASGRTVPRWMATAAMLQIARSMVSSSIASSITSSRASGWSISQRTIAVSRSPVFSTFSKRLTISREGLAFSPVLQRADFLMGVASGRWSLAREVTETAWPYVFTFVAAAPRPKSSERWLVRWDLDGYNAQSPTGAFWNDLVTDETPAETFLPPQKWPKGRPGSVVAAVFKVDGWAAPGKGFYHPYDRFARNGHNDWPTANPTCVWTPNHTLVDFLALGASLA